MLQNMRTLFLTASIFIFFVNGTSSRHVQTEIIPSAASNDTSSVQFTSVQNGFDGPHVSPINSTVFEWWWFSVLAPDSLSSLAVIFFTTSVEAFPFAASSPSILSINIQALFPNGTQYLQTLPADSATVKWDGSLGNGVSGCWDGPSPGTFTGSSDLKKFEIAVDAPGLGVQGSLSLTSTGRTAPAHYPCTCDTGAGAKLDFIPHVGWSNAMPGAIAKGSFTLGGSQLSFSNAIGYHDKNWGDLPFLETIQSWYWGHASFGPYTVVFFDAIDESGGENVSAYVAKDGAVLLASCDVRSVSVRPMGGAAQYPPTMEYGQFNHLHVVFDLGGETLAINITKSGLVVDAPGYYYRWTGRAKGGIVGGEVFHGAAEFEEFTFV